MAYLHSCELGVHGKLRSGNCLIDGRFVLKITDFGLRSLTTPAEVVKDNMYYTSEYGTYYSHIINVLKRMLSEQIK